jgi:HEPN domain-containing protein
MAESGMTKEEYAQEWLSLAEMDLQSAEYLKGMRPMPLEIICFHSQQAVEKILKGFIVLQNVRPQKTHDLVELWGLCNSYLSDFDKVKQQCELLNEYSVIPRYPKEKTISEQQAVVAVENARTVLAFVKIFYPQREYARKYAKEVS